MRLVIQRVTKASVTIGGDKIAQIGHGFLVLVGISQEDSEETADKMVKKLIGLRIFEDGNGKTNLDLKAVNGQLLLVSQFTLYADCKKGNRPSFVKAGDPGRAKQLYEYMIASCKKEIEVVEQGCFGADMKVELLNDGPFTILLDSEQL